MKIHRANCGRGQDLLASFLARLVVVFVLGLLCTPRGQAAPAGILIPAPGRVDMVHDSSRQRLYITSGNKVLRYDLDKGIFTAPLTFGTGLCGLDISPDNRFLIVADTNAFDTTDVWIYVVNLDTDDFGEARFERKAGEAGSYAVAFGSDGAALITFSAPGAAAPPVRRFDPVTEQLTELANPPANSMVSTSGDGGVIGLAETTGFLRSYEMAIQDFTRSKNTSRTLFEIAVNRDGTLFALPTFAGTFVYDGNLNNVTTVGTGGVEGPIGLAFHPAEDLAFFAWWPSSDVRVYNTLTWLEVARYDAGSTFNWVDNRAFQQGRVKVSRDGKEVFVTVNGGVRWLTRAFGPPADLALGVTTSPAQPTALNQLTYTLTFTNLGPNAVDDARIVDELPAGVTFVSAVTSQGTVGLTGTTVSGLIGDMAFGDVASMTIVVVPQAAGQFTNVATITSSAIDGVPANNTVTLVTTIAPAVVFPEIAVEQPAGTAVADGGSRDFGTVSAGGSASLTFTVRNSGLGNLTGLGITIDGADASMFTVTANPVAPVIPTGSTTFTVRFVPTSAGAKTAALHLVNNDLDENPYDISLTGTSVAPEIDVDQPLGTGLADGGSRNFGSVLLGDNASLTFTVRNAGTADLTGLAITIDGPDAALFVVTSSPVAPVGPGSATTFTVRFAPASNGIKTANLHLASNDGDESPFDIALTGTGGSPQSFAQQAYLKASNTDAGDNFGHAVAISGDTIVVGATNETSSAAGVNGNQGDNSLSGAGAVYVYVRNGGTWTQQAYLKASNPGAFNLFGASVSVSGDTIVVGAPFEASNATGVNGNQADVSLSGAGAAYVFVRNGTTWSQQAYLKASNTGAGDEFGRSVTISGDTIAVGAPREDSNATGINGDQSNNSISNAGAAYVFVRNGTTWSQQAYVKASNTGLDFFGTSISVSGNTLVVGANAEASSATGVNGNQADNSAGSAGAAYVFVRTGNTWAQQAYLKASNTGAADSFGRSVAVDGDTIVIGAYAEDSNATGVNGDQTDDSLTFAGAAYVFVRNGTTWSQQAYLKASNTGSADEFGWSVAIFGDMVVVSANVENSDATGVDGNQNNELAGDSGAAYVFVRNGTTWSQQYYLKASNTGISDQFGDAVAISGGTIVIGAVFEDSNATGINGNQSDNSASAAGAAYVFAFPQAAEIDVEQPAGTAIADGGSQNFGNVLVGGNSSLTFTIRNSGGASLTGLGITIDGIDAAQFAVTSSPAAPVASAGSTTFTVRFAPSTTGLKVAALHIASNDADENPYDIALQGQGYVLSTVDPTFSLDAAGPFVSGLAVQPDGKFLMGGDFNSVGGVTRINIARINLDGTLDTIFDPRTTNAQAVVHTVPAFGVQMDGRIVIGGNFTTVGATPRNYIARVGAGGVADPGFDPNANGEVFGGTLRPDGKILMWGAFTSVGVATRNRVALLNQNGTVDPMYDPNANGDVLGAALQPDGRLVVGGSFSFVGGTARSRLARLNSDGSLDTAFNPNLNGDARGIALQPDGKIIVGGTFTTAGSITRNRLARLNSDGALDTSFSPTADGPVQNIALQTDGRILLGGSFATVDGTAHGCLARLNADGTVDSAFNPVVAGTAPFVQTMVLQADGKIVAGGAFATVDGIARRNIVRLQNDPATQSLVVPSASRVQWLRSGSTPETHDVVFELSTDGGGTWSPLGAGTRILGGWEKTGLSLTGFGLVRGRARVTGGNASGLVEAATAFDFRPLQPEIVVEQPVNVSLTDGGAVSFGPVLLGTNASLTFTVRNTGNANLVGLGITIDGPDAAQFVVSTNPASIVTPASSTMFTVRFTPTGMGARSAALHLASNDGDENPFDLALTGTANGPEIVVEQPAGTNLVDGGTLDFGSVLTGGNVSRTFTIRNSGNASLTGLGITIDGTDAAQFTVTASPVAPVLPSGSTTFTVRFTPAGLGPRVAALHIASNDADENPFDLAFTGVASGSEISVEQPVNVGIGDGEGASFGPVLVGTSSSLTFTIKNLGNIDLTGLGITIDGPDAGLFAVTTPPVAPVAGFTGSTTFTVRFAPTTSGVKAAAIHIENNDSNENPYDITLTGTGTAPEIAVFQPASVGIADGGARDFGAVLTTGSASLVFTVKNTGDGNLTGLGITIDGPNAAQFTVTTAPAVLVAPAGSTTFTVRFTPGTIGAKSAALHLANNDIDEGIYDIVLTGQGAGVQQFVQQAYAKATNNGLNNYFGWSVAASGDTIVIGARGESGSSGAAYVFLRNGSTWVQQAYLKASNAEAFDLFGYSVGISGDTAVVGAPGEASNATGVNGAGANNSALSSGAAYVFVRNGTNWSQQAYLKASNTGSNDQFGKAVAVSGDTIVVGAINEDSNATGVNGDASNNSVGNSGAAYVFARNGLTWSQQAYLKAGNTGANDTFGASVAVGGETIVVGAPAEDSNAVGVNGDGSNNAATDAGAAYVFARSGTAWSQQAYLKAHNTAAGYLFGCSVGISGDTVVVGSCQEASNATGVNGDGSNNTAANSGAAYVFARSGTNWAQQAYLKASNTGITDGFGFSVGLSGETVVVGAPNEDGGVSGINGDGSSNATADAGAAYVFTRSGTQWVQQAYVKASNPSATDTFGYAVAVSGGKVVVGAYQEDGNATTVNGDGSNNGTLDSGAAYAFLNLDFQEPVAPPVLTVPAGVTIGPGAQLALTNFASGATVVNGVTFSLMSSPGNASIHAQNGIFNWRPGPGYAGTTNLITVRLTDNSVPPLTDTKSFQIIVNPLTPVVLSPLSLVNGQARLTITGDVGLDFILQTTTDLVRSNWTVVFTTNAAAVPLTVTDTNTVSGRRFFRILLAP